MTEVSGIIRELLVRRGVAEEDFGRFLNPSLANLESPCLLPGVDDAVGVILNAVESRQNIVVFGDYDCDGVSAVAILVRTLMALNGNVEAFIPDRLGEGYGMSEKSVSRMLSDNPDVGLVITVDNGINSVEQIAGLRSRGISVVITDHHLPGDVLPNADAMVNPKVSAPSCFENLCGAGIAFVLANQLVSLAKARGLYSGPSIGGPMLVLAGLATITDVMPVLGQNRILVSEALRRFWSCAPIGLRELYGRAVKSGRSTMTSKDFGFMLGPRINAAGRMASGMEALELVTSDDCDITRELARIVDGYNCERKSVEQKMTDMAMKQVVEGAAAQVIELKDGHPGIAGIVAARVMEKLGETCPVCVIAGGHGSARSPGSINIRDAFVACSDCLERFGGHAAAGGFSVREGMIDEFRRKLSEYCTSVFGDDLERRLREAGEPKVEIWLGQSDITLKLAEDVLAMEPFGEGNPEPVFGMRGVLLADVKPMGQDGRHISSIVCQSAECSRASKGLRAVWWGAGDRIEDLRSHSAEPVDIAFTLALSDYGERHVELRLVGTCQNMV